MKINTKVVSDRFDDEVVVVNLETGFYYSFRKSAMDVWLLLERGLSEEQMMGVFKSSPENSNVLKEHIAQLLNEKLIVQSEGIPETELSKIDSIEFDEIEYAKFDDMSDLIMIDPIHDTDQEKGWPHKPEA